MPFRVGLLAYPAFVLMAQFGKASAVPEFEKAEAFSPESSRRPSSLNVSMKAVRKATKKKLLVPVGDGRYYVDREALRRSDRRMAICLIGGFIAFLPLAWVLLHG
ncbi:MAG: hypothetical protein Kow0022_01770 [Phycisphaerales bacterium]